MIKEVGSRFAIKDTPQNLGPERAEALLMQSSHTQKGNHQLQDEMNLISGGHREEKLVKLLVYLVS